MPRVQVSRLNPQRVQLSQRFQAAATPLEQLSSRSVLLAGLVEAASRRRDVRDLRARLVLLLLALRCPLNGKPTRSWYVPGAVARLGASGLMRAWAGFWGEQAPCLRSMRAHLGALEQAGVLQRSPGDWLPVRRNPEHPEHRPRWPETIHILDGEHATEFWAGPGARLIALHPEVRHSPDAWRKLFGTWRAGVIQHQLVFESLAPSSPARAAANPEDQVAVRKAGAQLCRRLRRADGPLEVLSALEEAGARLRGGTSWRAAAAWPRLRGAGAMLARAMVRGDRIRAPGGWLWRAFQSAPADELSTALVWLGAKQEKPNVNAEA